MHNVYNSAVRKHNQYEPDAFSEKNMLNPRKSNAY